MIQSVLIADDHPIVLNGIKGLIVEAFNPKYADEATNSVEVLMKMKKRKYDLVILDISMPGRSGCDIIPDIKKICDKTPILIVSVHDEKIYGPRVIRQGAAGYLSKESAPDELVKAALKTVNGKKYLGPNLISKIADDPDIFHHEMPHNKLSTREFEVMLKIAQGKTVTQIAEILDLSVKTISTNRKRILKKMAMESNAEIIYYAVTEKLL